MQVALRQTSVGGSPPASQRQGERDRGQNGRPRALTFAWHFSVRPAALSGSARHGARIRYPLVKMVEAPAIAAFALHQVARGLRSVYVRPVFGTRSRRRRTMFFGNRYRTD